MMKIEMFPQVVNEGSPFINGEGSPYISGHWEKGSFKLVLNGKNFTYR